MRFRTNRRLGLLVLLAAALAAAGCGKSSSTPTTPGTCTGTITDLTLKVNQAIPVGAVIPAGLDTAAVVFSIRVDSLTVPVATGASALLVERAALLRLTSGGTVTVQSGALSQEMFDDSLCVLQLGSEAHVYSTFTSATGATLALPFDGTSYHRFVVSGGEFPAFTDSVRSLPPVQITAPVANYVQDDTTTLNITWAPSTTDTTVRVLCQLRDSSNAFVRSVDVADAAGSARILGAAVAALPSHTNIVLTVARYRAVSLLVGTAMRPLAVVCMVSDERPILLTDPAPSVVLPRGDWRERVAAHAKPGSNGERFLRLPAWMRRD